MGLGLVIRSSGPRLFRMLSSLKHVLFVKNRCIWQMGGPQPAGHRAFPCSQVQPSAQIPEMNRLQTWLDTDFPRQERGRTFAGTHIDTGSARRARTTHRTSPFSFPLAHHVPGLLVERAHPSLSSHKYSRLQVSSVSGPNIKFFRALWSDPEPFVQFLGQLLGLSTFWIPACWLVRLESY